MYYGPIEQRLLGTVLETTLTGSVVSDAFAISGYNHVALYFDLSSYSSITKLEMYVDVSNNGTDWYPVQEEVTTNSEPAVWSKNLTAIEKWFWEANAQSTYMRIRLEPTGGGGETIAVKVLVSSTQGNGLGVAGAGGGGADTAKVKVSSTDTTPDYLEAKLVAGTYINLVKLGSPGNETYEINNTLTGLIYRGTWDASTGIYPTPIDTGDYYIVSVSGTVGSIDYIVGDWIIWNGSAWEKIDNTQGVTSEITANIGTTAVESFADTEGEAAVWDFIIKKGSNKIMGTIGAVWEAGTTNVQSYRYETLMIGDTSDVSLAVSIAAGTVSFNAIVVNTNGWTIRVNRKFI